MMRYLRFPDERTAIKCCPEWLVNGDWIQPTLRTEIAVRGTLYNDDGVYDDEGNTVTPPTVKDGFFIDVIRGVIPKAAQQYLINPATPDFVLG